jgi:HAD superfamily phosphatase (TIGR01668 family)
MPLLKPDIFLVAVQGIEPAALAGAGFRHVLLDVDNTIVARGTHEVAPAAREWVAALRREGIGVCLLSNNWHRVVHEYAAKLGVPIVYKAIKPLPFAFLRAMGKLGARRRETLVVGDQLVTDVLGAHILGMKAMLVLPLAEQDLRHTLLLRRLERLLLRGMRPTDEAGEAKTAKEAAAVAAVAETAVADAAAADADAAAAGKPVAGDAEAGEAGDGS